LILRFSTFIAVLSKENAMSENHVSVPIPVSLFVDFHQFAAKQGRAADAVGVIQSVLENWLDMQDWSERTFPSAAGGFRWKTVVLPDTTKIRMRYLGEYHYASIEGDRFIWNGEASSPGQFVNGVTGTSRSAWRDIEVKRPTDPEWIAAHTLRSLKP
jgi:hypothetical protein